MSVDWIKIEHLETSGSGRVETRVRVAEACPWFSGHFPAQPILPGVALLGLVGETVRRQGQKQGRNLEIHGLNRVRFKALSFPGQDLVISVGKMPPDTEAKLAFEISRQGEQVSQGIALVRETDPQG